MGILNIFKQEEVPELEVYDKSLQPWIDDLVTTIQIAAADGKVTRKKEQSVIMSKHHALKRAIIALVEKSQK